MCSDPGICAPVQRDAPAEGGGMGSQGHRVCVSGAQQISSTVRKPPSGPGHERRPVPWAMLGQGDMHWMRGPVPSWLRGAVPHRQRGSLQTPEPQHPQEGSRPSDKEVGGRKENAKPPFWGWDYLHTQGIYVCICAFPSHQHVPPPIGSDQEQCGPHLGGQEMDPTWLSFIQHHPVYEGKAVQ